MKNLLLALFLCLPLLAFAQSEPPRDESGKIVFSEVVPVDGADQAALYSRALKAIPANAKEVVKQEPSAVAWQDEKQMMIVTQNIRVPINIRYAVILQNREGRYRYDITDLALEPNNDGKYIPVEEGQVYKPLPDNLYYKNGALKPAGQGMFTLQQSYREEIDKAISDVINNIKRAMALPTDDNW